MIIKDLAKDIFLAGIKRVLPGELIKCNLSLNKNTLSIGKLNFNLNEIENIFVIGAGKASALMAAEVEKILGQNITKSHIVVKYGHSCNLKYIKVTEAGHPTPDSNGIEATKSIMDIAKEAKENDLVLCLLSGGGSALLTDIPGGSTLEELKVLNNLLVNSGASINEINTVRKHLSTVKGGQLAWEVYPATLVSLILSDVIGDPLDVIASGPTSPDPSTFYQALGVLDKYGIKLLVSKSFINHLTNGINNLISETLKLGDPAFSKTYNLIIGNNSLALNACKQKAIELGMNSEIVTNQLLGDVSEVAKYIVEKSIQIKNNKKVEKPTCLLFGGEPTINITGKGLGGRNQHLALMCGELIKNQKGITILVGGTHGSDGPTDAAGAIVDTSTFNDSLKKRINPLNYLKKFDSYNFFRSTYDHIITGPTMTNVMDIMVVIVE